MTRRLAVEVEAGEAFGTPKIRLVAPGVAVWVNAGEAGAPAALWEELMRLLREHGVDGGEEPCGDDG